MAFKKSKLNFLKHTKSFYWLAGIGFLLKWWLVSGQEIEPIYNPAEESGFLLSAKWWYWGADSGNWGFYKTAIYPLFIAIVGLSKIPLVIVQELLFCGAAYYMTNSFRRNGLHTLLAGMLFWAILFHPIAINLMSQTVSEGLFVSLLMIALAQLLRLSLKQGKTLHWENAITAGITLALLWHLQSSPFFITILIAVYFYFYAIRGNELALWRTWGKQGGLLLIGLVSPILFLNLTLRIVNLTVYGEFNTTGHVDPAGEIKLSKLLDPNKILDTATLGFRPMAREGFHEYFPQHQTRETLALYDKQSNRRQYLAYRWVPKVKGWVFFEGEEIQNITTYDHDGSILASSYIFQERPDVQNVYSEQNAPIKSGFEIEIPKADYPDHGVTVVFKSVSGKTYKASASLFLEKVVNDFETEDGSKLHVCIDEITSGRKEYMEQEWVHEQLYQHYGKIYIAFLVLSVTLLLVRWILFNPLPSQKGNIEMIFITEIVAISWILYLTISSTGISATTVTELFPTLVLLPLLFALICQHSIAGIKKNRFRWKSE